MAARQGQRGHDLGLDAPHELLRSIESLEGTVELAVALAPRPEYGLVRPLCRPSSPRSLNDCRVTVCPPSPTPSAIVWEETLDFEAHRLGAGCSPSTDRKR